MWVRQFCFFLVGTGFWVLGIVRHFVGYYKVRTFFFYSVWSSLLGHKSSKMFVLYTFTPCLHMEKGFLEHHRVWNKWWNSCEITWY